MLTDKELRSLQAQHPTENDPMSFARAVIAAYENKLREEKPFGALGYAKKIIAAYEAKLRAPEGWISVDDRLPDETTPVLIIVNESVRLGERRWENPGFEDTFNAYWYWDDPEDDGQEWERNDVTHWMPVPKPPVSAAIRKLAGSPNE